MVVNHEVRNMIDKLYSVRAEALPDLRHRNKRRKFVYEEGRVCVSQKLSPKARCSVVTHRTKSTVGGESRFQSVQVLLRAPFRLPGSGTHAQKCDCIMTANWPGPVLNACSLLAAVE